MKNTVACINTCVLLLYLQAIQDISMQKVHIHDAGGLFGRRTLDHSQRQVCSMLYVILHVVSFLFFLLVLLSIIILYWNLHLQVALPVSDDACQLHVLHMASAAHCT